MSSNPHKDILSSIYDSTSSSIKQMETKLTDEQSVLKDKNISIDKLNEFQMEVSKFTVVSQLASNVLKAVTDVARSIVRNMA